MILGILDKKKSTADLKRELLPVMQARGGGEGGPFNAWAHDHLAFGWIPSHIDTLDETPQPFVSHDRTVAMVFQGKLYNSDEIRDSLSSRSRFMTDGTGEVLVHSYERSGEQFLDRVNGKFAFALWDRKQGRLLLGRDRFGVESVFYHRTGDRLVFSSSLRGLLATGWVEQRLNHQAVLQYLLFCYNPGEESFFEGIYKLPAGHLLSFDGADLHVKKYWHLSFAETEEKSEDLYRQEVLHLIEDAIRIRLAKGSDPGILLSGGTDSSTIVSLASRLWKGPIRTFSFRCRGRSFDESYYARLIADHYQTEHCEVEFGADRLPLMSRIVESMEEPFCDVGIEIATYLLGQTAQGKVSYLLSGEGGDELFAGHPVYTADKMAAFVDGIPRAMLRPLTGALQRLPDSDQKKNLQVKLKRFAYSLSFPRTLFSHRWRIYYTPEELRRLCTREFLDRCRIGESYDGVLKYNREADGEDQLSRSLYSDYYTLVDFYLRRLGLLRTFGIESRLPLLDYRLAEYAAKIPSRLKLRGMSDTKYLYRRILTGTVPREILFDRPKLGHSVPLKNWLREDIASSKFMGELVSSDAIGSTGFFQPDQVQDMVAEHKAKAHNHSHRLWGLAVLELWLRSIRQ